MQGVIQLTVHFSNLYLSNLGARMLWGTNQKPIRNIGMQYMWLPLCLWLVCFSFSSRMTCSMILQRWDGSVVPYVHPIFLSENRHDVSIFLITRDYHNFWGMMESGLATESVSSFRTMGYIISGSMDIHIFLMWCLTWSSLMMERTSLPIPWLKIQWLKRCEKSDYHWKLRQKCYWAYQSFSYLLSLFLLLL